MPLPQLLRLSLAPGALLLALGLGACASGAGKSSPGSPQGPPAPSPGLSLPAPASLHPRQASQDSSSTQAAIQAYDYDQGLPSNRVNHIDTGVLFSPAYPGAGVGGLAYAMFSFDLSAVNPAPKARAVWDTDIPPTGSAWIGLANLSKNRWDWFRQQDGQAVSFGSLQDYKDVGDGHLLAVVALSGTDLFQLLRLRIGEASIVGAPTMLYSGGFAPAEEGFDATDYGVPGALAHFNADFDGDGSYDDIDSASPPDLLDVSAGHYKPVLRYHDDEGLSQETHFTFNVFSGTWASATLDGDGVDFDANQPRLALIGGVLSLAYLRSDLTHGGQNLVYRQATDALANAWGPIHDAQTDTPAFFLSRLQEVQGTPAIAFCDAFDNVEFAHATDAAGTSWNIRDQALDFTGADDAPDLCVINGNPALAMVGGTHSVVYKRAADPAGLDWSTTAYGVADNAVGRVEMAELAGLPVMCYCESAKGAVIQSTDPNGEQGGWPTILSAFTGLGTAYPAYGLHRGLPLCLFHFSTIDGNTIFYLRAKDPAGTQAWTSGTVLDLDNSSDIGHFTQYVDLPGFDNFGGLALSYDAQNKDCVATFFDLTNAIPTYYTLGFDSTGDVGAECSLVLYEGVPIAAYEDHDHQSIKIAVFN